MRRPRWSDYAPSEPADSTAAIVAAPEPTDDPPAVPIFGVGPFTPKSKCAHHCKRCGGDGWLVSTEDGSPFHCPDCGGTGASRLPEGSILYCPVCHQHGMDGSRALPLDVKPLPIDPPEAEAEAAA